MKKLFLLAAFAVLASSLLFWGCKKDDFSSPQTMLEESSLSYGTTTSRNSLSIPIEKIKDWFEKQNSPVNNLNGVDTSIFKPMPKWELAHTVKSPDGQVFTVIPVPSIGLYSKTTSKAINELGTANVIITQLPNNTYKASVVMTIADADYYARKNGVTSSTDYSGIICSFDAKGNFKSGVRLINGVYSGKVGVKKVTDKNSVTNSGSRECISKSYIIAFPCMYVFSGCENLFDFQVIECEDGINSGSGGSSGSGAFTDFTTSSEIVGQGGGWAGNSGNGTPGVGSGFGGGGASNVPKSEEELLAEAFSEAVKFGDIMDKDAKNIGGIAISPTSQKKGHLVTSLTWEEFAKKMKWEECGLSGNITVSQQSYFLMNPSSFDNCNSIADALNVLKPMEDLGFKYPESRKKIEEVFELAKKNPQLLSEVEKYLDSPFSNKATAIKYLDYLDTKPDNPMSWEDFKVLADSAEGLAEDSPPKNIGPVLDDKTKICPKSIVLVPDPHKPQQASCGLQGLQYSITGKDNIPQNLVLGNAFIYVPSTIQPSTGVSTEDAIANAVTQAMVQLQSNIDSGIPIPKNTNGTSFSYNEWFLILINASIRNQWSGISLPKNIDVPGCTLLGHGYLADPLINYKGVGRLGAISYHGTQFKDPITVNEGAACP